MIILVGMPRLRRFSKSSGVPRWNRSYSPPTRNVGTLTLLITLIGERSA